MSTEDDFDGKECESGPNLLLQKHKRERDLCEFCFISPFLFDMPGTESIFPNKSERRKGIKITS